MIREVYVIVCEHPGCTGYEIDDLMVGNGLAEARANLHRGVTHRLNTLKRQGLVRSEPFPVGGRMVNRWYPVRPCGSDESTEGR